MYVIDPTKVPESSRPTRIGPNVIHPKATYTRDGYPTEGWKLVDGTVAVIVADPHDGTSLMNAQGRILEAVHAVPEWADAVVIEDWGYRGRMGANDRFRYVGAHPRLSGGSIPLDLEQWKTMGLVFPPAGSRVITLDLKEENYDVLALALQSYAIAMQQNAADEIEDDEIAGRENFNTGKQWQKRAMIARGLLTQVQQQLDD